MTIAAALSATVSKYDNVESSVSDNKQQAE